MSWYVFFKWIHILAAIMAFGTALLAFPFLGAFGAKEPPHLNFALRASYALGRRAVTPLAILTFVIGVVLIFVGGWNLLENEWLLISIGLFAIAFVEAQFVTLPAVNRLVQLTSSPPPPGATGPPPEVTKLVNRLRIGGIVSALTIAPIPLLMVWKPGAGG